MKIEFRIITAIFAVFAIVLLQQYYITNISSYSTHLDEESLNITKYEGKEFTKEGTILSINEDTFIIKDPSYSSQKRRQRILGVSWWWDRRRRRSSRYS